jgi:hypothetical protein
LGGALKQEFVKGCYPQKGMAMIGFPLRLVQALRWVPRSRAYDKHLTDCAALAVLYHPYGGCPPLTWRHVLKLDHPLPPFAPAPPSNVTWLEGYFSDQYEAGYRNKPH